MGCSRAYEDAQRRFVFHLAQDAITSWLEEHPHTAAYIAELERRGEEAAGWQNDDRIEAFLEEATGAANALVDEVRKATGDDFTGTRYNALVEAAQDRLQIGEG